MGLKGRRGISKGEVKFYDLRRTNISESTFLSQFRRSRAKEWGLKMIRNRRNPLSKLCCLCDWVLSIVIMTEGQTQELREIKGFEFGGEYGRKTET